MSCVNPQCAFSRLDYGDEQPSALKPELRCMVADAVHKVKFRKGQALFLEGQASNFLYALTSGMVKICHHTPQGTEQIIGLSHPGNLLVGLQSIAEEHYAYTAAAATPVSACRINHHALLTKVRERGDVAMSLVRALNAQLAHSRALIEVMGKKNAAAKIASLILLMVPGKQHEKSQFSLPFSRREIAELLNLSEETVCRMMAEMQREGIVKAPRQNIAIVDWNRLRAMADAAVVA